MKEAPETKEEDSTGEANALDVGLCGTIIKKQEERKHEKSTQKSSSIVTGRMHGSFCDRVCIEPGSVPQRG